jgi:hypothetical protein
MIITDFTHKYTEQAQRLAKQNYDEEKKFVPSLPEDANIPDLTYFADNRLGVVAIEGERLIGFLCCYKPWDNAFGTKAKGTFSPLHAHGVISENRELIYRMLYQKAAQKWVEQDITYHGIALYAHDEQAKKALFTYGFGLRCVDAIKSMDKIKVQQKTNLQIRRLEQAEIPLIRPLREQLSAHLGESPCFMYSTEQEYQSWLSRAEHRNSKMYAAFEGEKIIAFIEAMHGGENFVTEFRDMMSICGAFCVPNDRGNEIVQNLLNVMIDELQEEGYQRLGVDFESFNPTAYGFWSKYFEAYTNSVTRRIDDVILNGR